MALRGLLEISKGGFKSKDRCREFFEKRVKEKGLKMTAEELMDQVAYEALKAYQGGYVYDGPADTSTQLTASSFPQTSASKGTVASWFEENKGADALSQFDGSAIWIRADMWERFMFLDGLFRNGDDLSKYAYGTLLHELLHKKAVGGGIIGHTPFMNVLGTGVLLAKGNGISSALAAKCF